MNKEITKEKILRCFERTWKKTIEYDSVITYENFFKEIKLEFCFAENFQKELFHDNLILSDYVDGK